MKKELVISAYEREYKPWIKYLNDDVKITPYRKGKNLEDPTEIFIQNNVGQDVHTFFYHIVSNYENLADYTAFSQDYPFDHVLNYIEILNGNPNYWKMLANVNIGEYYVFSTSTALDYNQGAAQLGFPKDAYTGKTLICEQSGYPHHRPNELNIDTLWPILFNDPIPSRYEFVPAGHFIISREHIHLRSKSFYETIVHQLETRWRCPYEVERLEGYIFNPQIK